MNETVKVKIYSDQIFAVIVDEHDNPISETGRADFFTKCVDGKMVTGNGIILLDRIREGDAWAIVLCDIAGLVLFRHLISVEMLKRISHEEDFQIPSNTLYWTIS